MPVIGQAKKPSGPEKDAFPAGMRFPAVPAVFFMPVIEQAKSPLRLDLQA